jgi:hypothetical protein
MRLCSHGHAVTLLYIAVLVTSEFFLITPARVFSWSPDGTTFLAVQKFELLLHYMVPCSIGGTQYVMQPSFPLANYLLPVCWW